jgi:hypothetical protein
VAGWVEVVCVPKVRTVSDQRKRIVEVAIDSGDEFLFSARKTVDEVFNGHQY